MRKAKILPGAILAIILIAAASVSAQNWVTFEGETATAGTLQLSGILTAPEGEGPFPAVVLLHVCAG